MPETISLLPPAGNPAVLHPRRFLFLQGPTSPFFAELAAGLRARGHATRRINLCLGDRLFWRGPGAADFRGRAADWPGFVARFLEEDRITDLVLLGEQRAYHRVAIAAARARGIAVTVTDFGYLRPDWIVLERDGMGPESRFPRDPAVIRALARSCPRPDLRQRHADSFPLQALWDIAFHMSSLLPWPFPHYESFLLHPAIPAYLGTGLRLLTRGRDTARAAATLVRLRGSGPLFLFAMQMETDFSIRAYSRFRDNDAVIAEVVASFARHAAPNARLMLKVHPLDPGLKAWGARIARVAAQHAVADRVHYLAGALPADPAVLACQGVVTVNSTLGLRSVALGRPTLALGDAIWDIPGLTWQGGLDRFWRDATAPDAGLSDAFMRAIAACLHVRGVYYAKAGRRAAVAAAVERLDRGLVGAVLAA